MRHVDNVFGYYVDNAADYIDEWSVCILSGAGIMLGRIICVAAVKDTTYCIGTILVYNSCPVLSGVNKNDSTATI